MAALADRVHDFETAEANRIADRMAIVHLAKTDPRAALDMSWNIGVVGRQRGRRIPKLLERGKSITLPLDKVVGFFGPFMIQRDLEDETDERRIRDGSQFFEEERQRIIRMYGDYPRPFKLSEGNQPTGPCRLPHVVVTIIEADGTKSEPFDLHEVYRVGEFDVDGLRPSDFTREAATPSELETVRSENSELRDAMLELRGQMSVLLAERSGKTNGSGK